MSKIKISSPRIDKKNSEDGSILIRMEADTVWDFDGDIIEKTLFYEVDKKWGKYFTPELSDSFVLALVDFAMEKKADIEYEAPMTEDMRYQLERYLIPIYDRKIKTFHSIRLSGPVTTWKPESEGVTGTGFSGGVDSFYSVLSHQKDVQDSKKVTHLLLAVNGAADTGVSEEMDKKWLKEEVSQFRPAAEKMGLEFIAVNSNVSLLDNYRKHLKGGGSVRTGSFVHALRKLFGTYYWASAYEADVIEFVDWDGGFMEAFNVPLLSVDGLRFYHSGCEVNRVEKVEYIADNSVVQKTLTVCGHTVSCGHCVKCLRTMAELNSVGKIDEFESVFDIEDFHKHYTSKLAREFSIDHPPFTTDIKKSMKQHGVKMPLSVPLKVVFIFRPYYFLKKCLRNNRFLMNLWYNKGLAEKMGEGIPEPELAKARFEGKA